MRWVVICSIGFIITGAALAVHFDNASYLDQASGLVAICAALGAIFLLSRSEQIADAQLRLSELDSLVRQDRAEELVRALQRKDRLDQLTLIILSAASSAMQAFADGALTAGKWLQALLS